MRPIAFVLAIALLSSCYSSQYVPRDRRKIYMTMQDGKRGYMLNGQFRPEFGFGGSLVESVAGNPAAVRAAETFRSRSITGFVATMVGSVCMPTALLYDQYERYEADGRQHNDAALYIGVGCGIMMVAGLAYFASGMPYQYDALNMYNDSVDAQPAVQWPPPPAPTFQNYGPP